MKALVTGVAGFIGSHIAERLIEDGHEVIGIDDLSAGHRENVPEGVNFFSRDIYDIEEYSFILKGVEVIFNNAASKKNICQKNPDRDMKVNGIGTHRLVREAVNAGVTKFVHASTGSVYGEASGLITEHTERNPVSFYGVSKMAGESYALLYRKDINVSILRYFHVWGDRQEKDPELGGVVAIFSDRIQRGLPIMIHGDGNQKRVFTWVKDIVEANMLVWKEKKAEGEIYNCAGPERTTISELAVMLMRKYETMVDVIQCPPLNGDIYNFYVITRKIEDLGLQFKSIKEII